MIFISSLLALVLIRGWGIGANLQRDTWFLRWMDVLQSRRFIAKNPVLSLALTVVVPAVSLALVVYLIAYFLSSNWLFFIYVPVLLYCLGRGSLTTDINHYLTLSRRGDNVAASQWVDELRSGTAAEDSSEVEDWQQLHTQAFDIISYRCFERLFAVLFWFFILGAAGALIYRLSVMYREKLQPTHAGSAFAQRWLWLLEWPGARALGLTWALVGNFDSCYSVIKHDFFDATRSTIALLSRSLRGALGMTPAVDAVPYLSADSGRDTELDTESLSAPIISGINTEPDSLGLISASLSLFDRSLLLWVCVMALVTIML